MIAALFLTAAAPGGDWTPHTAAALLDTTFPSAETCQAALNDAQARESHARPVRGLSYTHLFEQGACRIWHHQDKTVWRIRMQWKPRSADKPTP